MNGLPKSIIYIAAGLLLVGVFPLPYSFYMLLRFIACGIFAWASFVAFEQKEKVIPWVFIVLAIVFNPIIKIHFPKEFWAIIDFCSGVFLIIIKGKIQEKSHQTT